MPRIKNALMVFAKAQLPPFHIAAMFDEEGVSEPIDLTTFECCLDGDFQAATAPEEDLPEEGSKFFGLPSIPFAEQEYNANATDLGAQEAEARRMGKPTYNEIATALEGTKALYAGAADTIAKVNAETAEVQLQLNAFKAKLAKILCCDAEEDAIKHAASKAVDDLANGRTPVDQPTEAAPAAVIDADALAAVIVGVKGVGDKLAVTIAEAVLAALSPAPDNDGSVLTKE